ncbi:MAG: hypothetical protein V1872_02385 [bacterium]
MTKRPTIKGRGAEIFLGKEDSTPEKKHTVILEDQCADKATFYLPSDLLNRLDTLWMDLRRSNRRLRKSHLVKELIEKGLKQYEGNV